MVNMRRNRLKAEKLDAKLILQVHDELIVECPEAESDTVKRKNTWKKKWQTRCS